MSCLNNYPLPIFSPALLLVNSLPRLSRSSSPKLNRVSAAAVSIYLYRGQIDLTCISRSAFQKIYTCPLHLHKYSDVALRRTFTGANSPNAWPWKSEPTRPVAGRRGHRETQMIKVAKLNCRRCTGTDVVNIQGYILFPSGQSHFPVPSYGTLAAQPSARLGL